jgi:cytochrome c5
MKRAAILTAAAIAASLATLPARSAPSDEAAGEERLPAACDRPADYEIIAWRDRYMALGRDVYEWACAACHDEGKEEAPRIGQKESWADRSPLWSAVLLEHAKQGWLDMPAKGGHPYLSDRAVQAAGEYMLCETFPELPRD